MEAENISIPTEVIRKIIVNETLQTFDHHKVMKRKSGKNLVYVERVGCTVPLLLGKVKQVTNQWGQCRLII